MSTDSDDVADMLRLVRNHGMLHGYDTRHLGFNYRLPETAAAIGSVQMDKLGGFLRARKRNAGYLRRHVERLGGVEFTQESPDRTHVFYLYTLYLKRARDAVKDRLAKKGVGAAVYFHIPVHRTPLYAKLGYAKKRLPNTEAASRHVLSLPVHPGMTSEELATVADEFASAARDLI